MELDHEAALGKRVQRRLHVLGPGTDKIERAAGDSRGAGIASSLDSIGHDLIVAAAEALDSVDDEVRRTDSPDLCAHREQQVAKIDDLGFAGGVEQLRAALAENRRHDGILGRSDRDDWKAE